MYKKQFLPFYLYNCKCLYTAAQFAAPLLPAGPSHGARGTGLAAVASALPLPSLLWQTKQAYDAATCLSWLLMVSRLIGPPAYIGTVFSALPTFYCRYSVYLALPIPLHCGDIFILWFQPAERVHFALHNKPPAMRGNVANLKMLPVLRAVLTLYSA